MKYPVFIVPALAVVGVISTVSDAIAVEFNFSTLQERPSEVIEQHNIIENFRALQQERLSNPEELVEGDSTEGGIVEGDITEGDSTDATQSASESDLPEVSVPEVSVPELE